MLKSTQGDAMTLQKNSLQQILKLLFVQNDDKNAAITEEYFLGNYHKDQSRQYGDGKFWIQKYLDGDFCEVGAPVRNREVEVHFICGANNHIVDVVEVSVCQYVILFATPIACSNALVSQLIRCWPVAA